MRERDFTKRKKRDLTKVRETIGIDDEPISVNAIEKITVIELGMYKMEAKGIKVNDVKSTDLAENMIISVSDGNIPNKQKEFERE